MEETQCNSKLNLFISDAVSVDMIGFITLSSAERNCHSEYTTHIMKDIKTSLEDCEDISQKLSLHLYRVQCQLLFINVLMSFLLQSAMSMKKTTT